jgi:HPt (histidine-containing phosphotransfer) domain-containing protein
MTYQPQPPISIISGQTLGMSYFLDLIPDVVLRAQKFRTSWDVADEEILSVFADQMRLSIRALHAAVEENNPELIRRQAHKLQGMGGTAGFPEISVVGEELSKCAKQDDFEGCRHLVERLDRWQANWDATSVAGGVYDPDPLGSFHDR